MSSKILKLGKMMRPGDDLMALYFNDFFFGEGMKVLKQKIIDFSRHSNVEGLTEKKKKLVDFFIRKRVIF